MPNGNIMKVYQRYDETDPARTDTYFRQKREAVAYGKNFIKPSPVLEHDILTSKGGLIDALTTIPMRNAEPGDPELDFNYVEPPQSDEELTFTPNPDGLFRSGDPESTPEQGEEEPEIEF